VDRQDVGDGTSKYGAVVEGYTAQNVTNQVISVVANIAHSLGLKVDTFCYSLVAYKQASKQASKQAGQCYCQSLFQTSSPRMTLLKSDFLFVL
jgi:hypothetical protein